MDDLVLDVQQIAQFQPTALASPTDLFLGQQQLGTPFYQVSAFGLVAGAISDPRSAMGFGLTLPPDAQGSFVAASLTTPLGFLQGWNFYNNNRGGQSLLRGGAAGAWSFDGELLSFSTSAGGVRGNQIPSWSCAFAVDARGNLSLPGNILATQLILRGAACVAGDLQVNGNEFLGGDLNAVGDITARAATLSGMLAVNANASVSGTLSVGSTLTVNGISYFRQVACGTTPLPTANDGELVTAAWVNAALAIHPGADVTPQPPANPEPGTLWFDDTCKQLYVWDGSQWTVAVNQDVGAPICSPNFLGQPQVPTAPDGDSSCIIANTAWVSAALTAQGLATQEWVNQQFQTFAQGLTTVYAPLASPEFSGVPSGPTAPIGTSTGQLATTAFVMAAVVASTTGVASFNGRSGAVTLTHADVIAVGAAPIASPAFTGAPQVPSPPVNDNSNQIANTAWVQAALASAPGGVSSFNTRTGAITLTAADVSAVGGALLAGPAFTGIPTAPTAAPATSTTQIATTEFVSAALLAQQSVATFNGRTGNVTLQASDISAAGGAMLASPAFTGVPTAATAAPGTATTQLATCAFVAAAIAGSVPVTTWNGRNGAVTMTATDVASANGAIFRQADAAPSSGPQTLWFDSLHGQLYVNYVDPVTSAQSWVIANTVPQAAAPQYFRSTVRPANPSAGTNNTSGVMMGFAIPFTPKSSGKILFLGAVDGNNTSGSGGVWMAWGGPGTPPAFGAAATGSSMGYAIFGGSLTSATYFPVSMVGYQEGFVVGTTYWLDCVVAGGSGGTAQIYNAGLQIIELP